MALVALGRMVFMPTCSHCGKFVDAVARYPLTAGDSISLCVDCLLDGMTAISEAREKGRLG